MRDSRILVRTKQLIIHACKTAVVHCTSSWKPTLQSCHSMCHYLLRRKASTEPHADRSKVNLARPLSLMPTGQRSTWPRPLSLMQSRIFTTRSWPRFADIRGNLTHGTKILPRRTSQHDATIEIIKGGKLDLPQN